MVAGHLDHVGDFADLNPERFIEPDARTGAHHHGELESVIYVIRGRARMPWGKRLEFTAEAEPGGFIFVRPFVPHQEINASPDETLLCVVARSGREAIVVNLAVEGVDNPEEVRWAVGRSAVQTVGPALVGYGAGIT